MTPVHSPAPGIAFRIVRNAEEFSAVARAWDALYARAECAAFSLTSAAVQAFLTHRILPGQEAVVVLAETKAGLVAHSRSWQSDTEACSHSQRSTTSRITASISWSPRNGMGHCERS